MAKKYKDGMRKKVEDDEKELLDPKCGVSNVMSVLFLFYCAYGCCVSICICGYKEFIDFSTPLLQQIPFYLSPLSLCRSLSFYVSNNFL